jgi:uncharacterized protein (DUF433 family)
MMRLAASLHETVRGRDLAESPTFVEFSRQIRSELRQSGLLEQTLFDRITAAAWRLSRLDPDALAFSREELRAERSLHRALEMLESLRAALPVNPVRSAPPSPVRQGPEESPADSWRDRLTFDPKTSDDSPVVKGTWITVDHVISLIVDNWSWADILRSHPELTEDDIRSCLSYAIEQSQDGAC